MENVAQALNKNLVKFQKVFFGIVFSTNMANVTSGAIKEFSWTYSTRGKTLDTSPYPSSQARVTGTNYN